MVDIIGYLVNFQGRYYGYVYIIFLEDWVFLYKKECL